MVIRLFADFNNTDEQGRVRLNTTGTLNDLRDKQIKFNEGMGVLLDDGDGLTVSGIVQFSTDENIWVAFIDWHNLNSKK